MNVLKRDIVLGLLFAIIMVLFLNFTTIERIVDMESAPRRGVKMLYFSLWWYFITSLLYYAIFVVLLNFGRRFKNTYLTVTVIVVVALCVSTLLTWLLPYVREFVVPRDNPARRASRSILSISKGLNSDLYKSMLLMVLNFMFVYVQRLLYRNHEIARQNEQLQLESVKSQHVALIQHINPHFFFNSLNSLRYLISAGDNHKAMDFLDNLTLIFRKTLKERDNTLHTLSEELETASSYLHIIVERFEGKIFPTIDVDSSYLNYKIPPMSLLTLIENVVKHNKLSEKSPLSLTITTNSKGELVVSNTISPKFEQVQGGGLGLKSLEVQYQLLKGGKLTVLRENNCFIVKLPLI